MDIAAASMQFQKNQLLMNKDVALMKMAMDTQSDMASEMIEAMMPLEDSINLSSTGHIDIRV